MFSPASYTVTTWPLLLAWWSGKKVEVRRDEEKKRREGPSSIRIL